MLDDLKFIHEKDPQDALGIAEKQWQQYTHKFEITWDSAGWQPSAIMLAGMGGSAQAAIALSASASLKVPFEVVRNYDLPAHVNMGYLLICSSYSGNTEETLSALNQALEMSAQEQPKIIVMAAGGRLKEIAAEKNLSFIELPQTGQPRYSFGYQFAALSQLFEKLGLMSGVESRMQKISESVKSGVAEWRADVSTKDNLAKTIANEVVGKSMVIYSGPKLFPAAYKWKIDFNENAKNVAWCNQYPEFNHNEFIGWSSHPIQKPYGIIELKSQHEHPRVQKRFEVSNRLLSGQWPSPVVVDIPKGDTVFEDLAWAVALGDMTTIYVGMLNGVNPTPVDLVEKFKEELDK